TPSPVVRRGPRVRASDSPRRSGCSPAGPPGAATCAACRTPHCTRLGDSDTARRAAGPLFSWPGQAWLAAVARPARARSRRHGRMRTVSQRSDGITHATSTHASWLFERLKGAMREGSVLLHAPQPALQAPGGGENQLIQTGRYLERRGVRVRPFVAWTD